MFLLLTRYHYWSDNIKRLADPLAYGVFGIIWL